MVEDVNNLIMVYTDGMQLHKVNKQEKKCNMDMVIYGVVSYLYKHVVSCLDKGVVLDNTFRFNIKYSLLKLLCNPTRLFKAAPLQPL